MSPVIAIYPGSFDPITMGHVDIIQRGSRLFDRIVIAVLINTDKAPLFTVHERVDVAREVFRDRANVEVDTFDGLLVDYARRRQASVIVRGLRAVAGSRRGKFSAEAMIGPRQDLEGRDEIHQRQVP